MAKGTSLFLLGGTIICLASDGHGFCDGCVCWADVTYKTLAHPTTFGMMRRYNCASYMHYMLSCCWLPGVKGHSNVPVIMVSQPIFLSSSLVQTTQKNGRTLYQ